VEIDQIDQKSDSFQQRPVSIVMEPALTRILYWIRKGGFAVLDQALFAGTNFVVNILLARWLPPEQYGAFAVTYSILLLLAAFHTAVLSEPMMVFGVGKYAEKFDKYLGILLYGHWLITSAMSLALGLCALFFFKFGSQGMARALVGLSVALPFILLLWVVRRAVYVHFRLYWASAGSALYFMVMMFGVFLLAKAGLLSPRTTLITMGLAGVTVSCGLMFVLQPQLRFVGGNPTRAMVLEDHWKYGSWNVLSVGFYWASGQILMILVPIFLGLHASAVIAAVINLFRPLNLLMQSTTLLALPALSGVVNRKVPTKFFMHKSKQLVLIYTTAAFVYGMSMTSLSGLILHHLYAGKYDGYGILVFLFTLSYTASASVQSLVTVLKATGNTRSVLSIWVISALLVTLMAIPMMLAWGIIGAISVVALSYFISASVAWRKITLLGGSA